MLGFEIHPGYWVVAAVFAIGALVAWRKDYPGLAVILLGLALVSVLREILHNWSSSMAQ